MRVIFSRQGIFILLFVLFVSGTAVFLKSSPREAAAQGTAPSTFTAASKKDLKVTFDPHIGTPLLVTVPDVKTQFIELKTPQVQSLSLEDKAFAFFKENPEIFGLDPNLDPQEQLRARSTFSSKDGTGMRHVKLQQKAQGLDVFGAELAVHFNKEEGITSVNGTFIADIKTSPVPDLSVEQAQWEAENYLRLEAGSATAKLNLTLAELVFFAPRLIFSDASAETVLAWKLTFEDEVVLVNAHDKTIVLTYSLTSDDLYREVYTADGTSTLPGTLVAREGKRVSDPGSPTERLDSNKAYYYSGDVYLYFNNVHGRDSYDDKGSSVVSTINYVPKTGCPNAEWIGAKEQMAFCETYSQANDIVAHEFTHGVNQFSAGLIGVNESGALNESYADFFAAMVDTDDWTIGESVPNAKYVRDMGNPHNSKPQPQADHMEGFIRYASDVKCNGSNDKCGVHKNDGIPNKAAYLASEPGEHTFHDIPVNGIGREKAEKIYYKTLTEKLISTSNFFASYLLTVQACEELVGYYQITEANCVQVDRAFRAVGMNPLVQKMEGEAIYDFFGYSVSGNGDVNGDGYSDVLVGAFGNDEASELAGKAYLYFGGPIFDKIPDIEFFGKPNAELGLSVSIAGDVNNDGYDDIIIGTEYGNRAYIHFGGPNMDNVPDVILVGPGGSQFGFSVSGAGDVNGDDYKDVIIGAFDQYGPEYNGRAYIYFGGNLMDDKPDVILEGEAGYDTFGYSVSKAGDVNGDGYDDVIVGAPLTGAYIFYGGNPMNSIPDVEIEDSLGDSLGYAVNTAGDVNNDGYDDVLVLKWYEALLFLGGETMDNSPDLRIAASGFAESSVNPVGDINKDGYDDFMVGDSSGSEGQDLFGKAMIFFGGQVIDNQDDIRFSDITYGSSFGFAGSYGGDINGDSFPDIIIGAPDVENHGIIGAVHVLTIFQSPSLTVSKTGSGTGTVRSYPAGIDCGNDCSQIYELGTEVQLFSEADPGSVFVGYSGDCTGVTCSLTMDGPKLVTAEFAQEAN